MNVSPAYSGHINLDGAPLTSYPTYQSYPDAMNFTVEAVAAPGYRFVGWSGALNGTEPVSTLALDGDKEITANFALLLPLWLIIVLSVLAAFAAVVLLRRRKKMIPEEPSPAPGQKRPA